MLPLQWPLVGRHDELETFSRRSPTPAPTASSSTARRASARPASPTNASPSPTSTGGTSRGPRPPKALGPRRSGRSPICCPPGIADDRVDLVAVMAAVRPGPARAGQERSARAVRRRPPPARRARRRRWSPSSSTPTSSSSSPPSVRRSPCPPGSSRSGTERGCAASTWTSSIGPRSTRLLHLVLSGPVEASTIGDIWTASEGNVLFVRELVLAALERGHLLDQRGVWRLIGPLVTTPRLHELVAARLASLDASAREALDMLAVWEPTGLAILEAAVGREALEALDRSGLLAVRTDGRRQQVSLAHPLYGEILRSTMPALTRRRLLLEHADRIDAHGARRREDAIRVATARLEATGTADPDLLLKAARSGPLRARLRPGRAARPGCRPRRNDTGGRAAARRGAPRARRVRRGREGAAGGRGSGGR